MTKVTIYSLGYRIRLAIIIDTALSLLSSYLLFFQPSASDMFGLHKLESY